ncbi:hypothetical protein BH23BAC2_BH23BAC2_05960 [soil metagenome]
MLIFTGTKILKNMKKLIFLFLSLTLFTACSSDDDDNSLDGPDPILGTWLMVSATGPFQDQFCLNQQNTLTFNANNSGSATFYLTQAQCAPSNSSGNWTNRGNSNYTITVPVIGELQGSANFVSANRFTFTTNGGVLTFQKQ